MEEKYKPEDNYGNPYEKPDFHNCITLWAGGVDSEYMKIRAIFPEGLSIWDAGINFTYWVGTCWGNTCSRFVLDATIESADKINATVINTNRYSTGEVAFQGLKEYAANDFDLIFMGNIKAN